MPKKSPNVWRDSPRRFRNRKKISLYCSSLQRKTGLPPSIFHCLGDELLMLWNISLTKFLAVSSWVWMFWINLKIRWVSFNATFLFLWKTVGFNKSPLRGISLTNEEWWSWRLLVTIRVRYTKSYLITSFRMKACSKRVVCFRSVKYFCYVILIRRQIAIHRLWRRLMRFHLQVSIARIVTSNPRRNAYLSIVNNSRRGPGPMLPAYHRTIRYLLS